MKIQTIKVNITPAFLNKAQPVKFNGSPQSVAGVNPANATVSFVVDETQPASNCNVYVTNANTDIVGSAIGQIGLNLFVTSDCFA